MDWRLGTQNLNNDRLLRPLRIPIGYIKYYLFEATANYRNTPPNLIYYWIALVFDLITFVSLFHANNYHNILFLFNEIATATTLYYVYSYNIHTYDISIVLRSLHSRGLIF